MSIGNLKIAGESIDNRPVDNSQTLPKLHPAWSAFVRYCLELKHGEIDCLKIQDGLPVLAEVTRRKIKFT